MSRKLVQLVVVICVFVIGFMAGQLWEPHVSAQSPTAEWGTCEVAKDFGQLKAAADGVLFFESNEGQIRLVRRNCEFISTINRY